MTAELEKKLGFTEYSLECANGEIRRMRNTIAELRAETERQGKVILDQLDEIETLQAELRAAKVVLQKYHG